MKHSANTQETKESEAKFVNLLEDTFKTCFVDHRSFYRSIGATNVAAIFSLTAGIAAHGFIKVEFGSFYKRTFKIKQKQTGETATSL